MAWGLVQSTSFPWAVSSGSKIRSKQSGNTKRAVIKVMCSLQTPPMRVRSFSGLRGGVNSLCNMVNRSHDFHSTVAAATSEKASPILPKDEDMFETFTDKANEVIKLAQKETRRAGYEFVGPEMILLGLIGNDIDRIFGESADIAAKVLYSMDIYLEDARSEVEGIFGYGGLSRSVEIPFTTRALRVFQLSLAEAQQLGHNYIGSEHLLLGLLRKGGDAKRVLRKLGACPKNIRTQVMRMIEESAAEVVGDGSSGDEMPTLDLEEYGLNLIDVGKTSIVPGLGRIADGNEENWPGVEEYGLNLTKLAYEKELHPVVERKPLINTVIQILGRLSRNNPCLVGEHGVGKTSIVQGLAQRIADFDVPDFLSKKKVITLNKYLLQDRLKKIMEEIKECNEIVLFIDDVHTLTERNFDPCNIFMQALARNEVQCVVATTPDEYLKSMKNFPVLRRLFQPINVPEATVDETIEILKVLQEGYENRYNVCYTDEALVAAAHMSDQNIRHSFLPSKAIDLIDLAISFVFNKEKEQASVLRDQEMGHKINMLEIEQQRMEEMENNKSEGPTAITKADIEDTVSDISHLHAILYRLHGDFYSCEELKAWPNLYKIS